jgi:hypothetical protein
MPVQAISTTPKRLRILEDEEIDALYGRPRFTPEERQEYFAFSPPEHAAIEQFHIPVFYMVTMGIDAVAVLVCAQLFDRLGCTVLGRAVMVSRSSSRCRCCSGSAAGMKQHSSGPLPTNKASRSPGQDAHKPHDPQRPAKKEGVDGAVHSAFSRPNARVMLASDWEDVR